MGIKLRKATGGQVNFRCPGCNMVHGVRVEGERVWGWNGSFESPTFTPSIKVTGSQPITDAEVDAIKRGEKVQPRPLCCHSFVTDGMINFLDDCTHSLRGNHEIPDWQD